MVSRPSSQHREAIVNAFMDGYEGYLVDLAGQLRIPLREVRGVITPLAVAGFVTMNPNGTFRWNGTTRKKPVS